VLTVRAIDIPIDRERSAAALNLQGRGWHSCTPEIEVAEIPVEGEPFCQRLEGAKPMRKARSSPGRTSFGAGPAHRHGFAPVGLNLSCVRPITSNGAVGEVATAKELQRTSQSAGLEVQRVAHILGLVVVGVVLVLGHATALVTDFDSTAGYLRDGQYGNLYAKLTEQDHRQEPASSDSTRGSIGRNRPGRARPSERRLSPAAPSLPSSTR